MPDPPATPDDSTIERIEPGDTMAEQIRKFKASGLSADIVIQMTTDFELLGKQLVAHQITGHIDRDNPEPLYKLAMIMLLWFRPDLAGVDEE